MADLHRQVRIEGVFKGSPLSSVVGLVVFVWIVYYVVQVKRSPHTQIYVMIYDQVQILCMVHVWCKSQISRWADAQQRLCLLHLSVPPIVDADHHAHGTYFIPVSEHV